MSPEAPGTTDNTWGFLTDREAEYCQAILEEFEAAMAATTATAFSSAMATAQSVSSRGDIGLFEASDGQSPDCLKRLTH